MKNEITQEQVKELFEYRDGELYWKRDVGHGSIKAGDRAGGINGTRKSININNVDYSTHRLIFLFHYGFIPKFIFHANKCLLDNHIENLVGSTQANTLTQAQVQNLFDYKDGNLYWKTITGNGSVKVGDKAGSLKKNGRVVVSISNHVYFLHRIIFFYHHGYFPQMIDHINRDPLDNRIENLRECTWAENNRNRAKIKTRTSQFKGVSWSSRLHRWEVGIKVNGKSIRIGHSKNEHEAAEMYNNSAKYYFGEFAYYNNLNGSNV
jgi:hypothetical protein